MKTRQFFKTLFKFISLFRRPNPEWKIVISNKDELVVGYKRFFNILENSMLVENKISYPEGNEIIITSIIADVKIISKQ